jgi:uncharacterized protein YndB with AHSA1/START domain
VTDITGQIDATSRTVGSAEGSAGGSHRVVLRRRYPAPVADVWDACTSPARIARWLSPVTGDLRPGGSYQLEGNAGGTIACCEPPHLLRVTWVLRDSPPSRVELRLSAQGDQDTLLELEHAGLSDDAFWAQFGPGAVGVGWDLALLGLSLHLSGQARPDAGAWLRSPEGTGFVIRSSSAWGEAFQAAGAAPGPAAAAAREVTAFYAPHARAAGPAAGQDLP